VGIKVTEILEVPTKTILNAVASMKKPRRHIQIGNRKVLHTGGD